MRPKKQNRRRAGVAAVLSIKGEERIFKDENALFPFYYFWVVLRFATAWITT
jgi:hypothetical protein